MFFRITFVSGLIVFLLTSVKMNAATDSLVFKNGDVILGEIKSMDRGVLLIETDYSDSDFKIEWIKLNEIFARNFFLISLSDGSRYNGNFFSNEPGSIIIQSNGETHTKQMSDVVYLKSVDTDFWSRVYASIDFGLSLAKANNLQQYSARATVGYLADRWSADASYNTMFSHQDDVEATRRTDGGAAFNYFLPKDWYVPASFTFLSNTEQKLDIRLSSSLGIGNYILHTNHSYWGLSAGASYNNEKYSTEVDDRNSLEAYLGTELNLYDIGDLNLLTKLTLYPSITEAGRFRTDFAFDAKYDLPLDFYIKMGVTVNYDNQPAVGAGEVDYVFQTGLGWEW